MGLHVIHCDNCGSRQIEVSIKVDLASESCPCCHDIKTDNDTVYFCSQDCMFKWLAHLEVAEKGFPCPRCRDDRTGKSTGFMAGFESNGVCTTCDGTGRVKKRKTVEVEFDAERVALQMAFTKEIESAGGYESYLQKTAVERKARQKKNDDPESI